MNRTKLITVAALIVISLGATCLAQDPPKKDVGMAQQARGLGVRIPD